MRKRVFKRPRMLDHRHPGEASSLLSCLHLDYWFFGVCAYEPVGGRRPWSWCLAPSFPERRRLAVVSPRVGEPCRSGCSINRNRWRSASANEERIEADTRTDLHPRNLVAQRRCGPEHLSPLGQPVRRSRGHLSRKLSVMGTSSSMRAAKMLSCNSARPPSLSRMANLPCGSAAIPFPS